MRITLVPVLAFVVLVSLLHTGAAGAVAILGGGLAESIACPDGSSPCSTSADFTLDPPTPVKAVVGSIVFNPASVDISLTVPTYSMAGTVGSVTALDFSSVDYTVTIPTTSFDLGGGLIQINQPPGSATGMVAGTYDQVGGVGSGPFSDASVSFSNFSCLLISGTGQCGFQVGTFATTADLDLDVDGAGYDVVQSFNVIVPEPTSFALVGLGLVAVARFARSSRV